KDKENRSKSQAITNQIAIKDIEKKIRNFNKEIKVLSKSKELRHLNLMKKRVLRQIKKCIDPELGSNIMDLGFIYGLELTKMDNKYKVKIIMTLTSPFCPLSNYLASDVKEKVMKLKDVSDVEVEIVFNPQWNPSMLSAELQRKMFSQFINQ
ncbi:MAG: metal-sulfur cluster assembly factor, partial [Candidatus Micrarchaeia archaeon]